VCVPSPILTNYSGTFNLISFLLSPSLSSASVLYFDFFGAIEEIKQREPGSRYRSTLYLSYH
jgi:hypothetical protein